jgi:hypothetical protein
MNDWAQFCGRPSAGADAARHGKAKIGRHDRETRRPSNE